jgi:hypothetical protein
MWWVPSWVFLNIPWLRSTPIYHFTWKRSLLPLVLLLTFRRQKDFRIPRLILTFDVCWDRGYLIHLLAFVNILHAWKFNCIPSKWLGSCWISAFSQIFLQDSLPVVTSTLMNVRSVVPWISSKVSSIILRLVTVNTGRALFLNVWRLRLVQVLLAVAFSSLVLARWNIRLMFHEFKFL